MDQLAVIETKNLRIVPFTKHHITEAYIGWLNDPNVVKYSEQRHRQHTYESCLTYLKTYEGTPHLYWAVELRQGGEHIGNLNAYIDHFNKVAEVGIIMGRRAIYAFEAWKGVCNYLLDVKKMRKVAGGTLSVNEAILKIMQRSGMVEDGKKQRHYLVDGKEVDICYYAFFNSNYEG